MRRNLRTISLFSLLAIVIGLAGMVPAGATLSLLPDDTWGTSNQVSVILRVGGTIYLGGEFTALEADNGATMARNHLAAIDAATGEPTSFNPNVSGPVFGLAASPDGSRLYAVGNFTTVGGQARKMVAAFDLPSGALSSWKPAGSPNTVVRAVAVTSDKVYIGGSFNTLGSTPRAKLAALSPGDGSISTTWVPTTDGLVRDIVVQGTRVFIGGNFVQVNGTDQRRFAGLDASSGASACSTCYHPTYPILDIEGGPSRIYLAGGGGGGKAVAVSATTGAKLWEKKTDGNVQAVSTLNGVPYFGGHFFKYTSIAVNQLVRTDPVTGVLDQSWLPNVTAGFLGVFAVRGFNANLYVGGDFTRVAQTKQLNFAQWTDNAVSASIDVGVSLADTPDPVDAGSSLTYTATVTNAGPDAAAGVALTDNLPASATFVSASPSCTYSSGTHSVSCDLGTIAAGGSTAPTITVTPGSAGSLNNTVNVTAVGNDPNAANNSSSANTTVNAVAGADLNLTMSPANAAKIDQGSAFSYVLTVLNQGPDSDPSVTVTDTLPGNVTPAGAATTTSGSCSGTTTVTCALGAMNANDVDTITIPVTAPAQPQTVVNTASVDGLANDPDHGDDEVVRFNAVKDPALGGDTTAPSRTATQMFDIDADGFVDQVVVTFNENLAVCPAPCTSGWVLTNVPSGSSLQSVAIAGNQAVLSIGNEQNQPDTAVGLFRVQLATPNQIQDAAGNRAAFSAVAPTDKASPVAVGFRKGHNTSGVCSGAPSNGGVAEPCDELTSEWSEALLPSSIPSTTNLTITDPAGSGNDLLTISNFIQGSMDIKSNNYVTLDTGTASWASSLLLLQGGAAQDTVTVRIAGSCTGTGCASLASVGDVTVVYVPSATIKDLAGNPAAGSFTKFQKMF